MPPLDRVLLVLAVYAAAFASFYLVAKGPGRDERQTRLFIGLGWAVGTFFGNDALAWFGLMSPLPLVSNLLHTFVWIGFCLSWLYLGVRFTHGFVVQCALFVGASLVVKIAEHAALGTWELDHFLHVIPGNSAYILGWSLLDGLYPPITLVAIRFVASRSSSIPLVVR